MPPSNGPVQTGRRAKPSTRPWYFLTALICLGGLIPIAACGPQQTTVEIFHAGSLAPLVQELAARFETNHPQVVIRSESSGSLDVVRKVTELKKPCDLVATADQTLIARFLIPEYTDRFYSFLGNEIVLATDRSDFLDTPEAQLDWKDNWYELLFSSGASYGISDPNRDPAGYYTHLVWKLAEIHYDRQGLYRRFLGRLESRWTRPKSSELLALLQTHSLDFAFLYKSSAIQANLRFVNLPAQISLGEEAYADFYSQAFVRVAGQTPDSQFEITGSPIRYGVALLDPSNVWAKRFLEFALSPESRQIYRAMGYIGIPVKEVRITP